jgi:hypothetical protein
MPIPSPELIQRLKEKGFNPFIIHFTWEPRDDGLAAQNMLTLHEELEKWEIQGGHGWYLTGRRTMIVIGWTYSNVKLQELCLSVTYKTEIQADVSYCIDIHDLASVVEKDFGKDS